jgi:hypothetical protein
MTPPALLVRDCQYLFGSKLFANNDLSILLKAPGKAMHILLRDPGKVIFVTTMQAGVSNNAPYLFSIRTSSRFASMIA